MKTDENSGFCIMPWVHLNVWTDGRVLPCCINHSVSFGNVNEAPIEEIYNSPEARAFRLSMLQGRLPASCAGCSSLERVGAESIRVAENKKWSKHRDLVALTSPDGRMPELRFASYDVRISNLCNFSCTMCNTSNSSELAREQGVTPAVRKSFGRFEEFLSFLDRNLGDVEEIYFSGGEPLIMKEHYEVLRMLLSRGRTSVQLRYNTNLSKLSYRGESVLEYWKKFSNVAVGASLDASGALADQIRPGTVWKDIVENRKAILREVPHVRFWIAATVSKLNVLQLPEFHLSWIQDGLATAAGIHFNILEYPEELSVRRLDARMKTKVASVWAGYARVLGLFDRESDVAARALRVVEFAGCSTIRSECLT